MRTIKFRAWHLDDGMLYFDFDTFQRDYHDQYGNIMQFTGLHDKNGKEIYEGDVVALHFGGNIEFVSKVYFKSGSYKVNRTSGIDSNLNGFSGQWEVIGNIYENPEYGK